MKIAIVDYGASNLQSVANALSALGVAFDVISAPAELSAADKVILPGVGAAGSAMARLRKSGFADVLPALKIPTLGLCLGLQLFGESSEENDTKCLSIIPAKTKRFKTELKVPHMGWNKVRIVASSPLVEGVADGMYFYFVHSYYMDVTQEFRVGETDYGVTFSSIVRKNNFYATQFHPEKSGPPGMKLLDNFCRLC